MNLNENLYELNNLKEGLDGEENCYYINYIDPEGLECQAVLRAVNSEEAEEKLYNNSVKKLRNTLNARNLDLDLGNPENNRIKREVKKEKKL